MGMFDWFKVQSDQGPWIPPQSIRAGWQTKDLDCGLHLVVLRTDGCLDQHDFADPEEESNDGLIIDPADSCNRWLQDPRSIMFGKDFQIYVHLYRGETARSYEYRLTFRDGRFYKAEKIR